LLREKGLSPFLVVNEQTGNWTVHVGPDDFVDFVVELIRNKIQLQDQLQLSD
jgi:hypothetical protein